MSTIARQIIQRKETKMPTQIEDKLWSWTPDHDGGVYAQAGRTARLPIIHGHVALMPDAHIGIGATVGSVIATDGAVIPSAVGVDIGCGMVAMDLGITSNGLNDLNRWMAVIRESVPAGMGQGHEHASVSASKFLDKRVPSDRVTSSQNLTSRALKQFGTLGSGNHFLEVCLDENDGVWIVLHSGSRGVGKELAEIHITKAKALHTEPLEDPDLAWFVQGTDEFAAYIHDMLWAQDYAAANRQAMIDRVWVGLVAKELIPPTRVQLTINCHHNFCQVEHHDGKPLWITRKGAIQAKPGQLGIIPGSMGTHTYIVTGKGNPLSWNSCSHGAGRRMSRGQAKRELTIESLHEKMAGKLWQDRDAQALLDEHPDSYKDIELVMAAQADLVDPIHTLTQVLNYKGADSGKRGRR